MHFELMGDVLTVRGSTRPAAFRNMTLGLDSPDHPGSGRDGGKGRTRRLVGRLLGNNQVRISRPEAYSSGNAAFATGRQTPFGRKVPKFAVPATAIGTVTGLAYTVQSLITQYTAKANWYLVICGLVIQYTGDGPGRIRGMRRSRLTLIGREAIRRPGRPKRITGRFRSSSAVSRVVQRGGANSGSRTGNIRLKVLPNANMGVGVGTGPWERYSGLNGRNRGTRGFETV